MYASENADLRSWITLPENVQYLRVPVKAGANHLLLQHAGGLDGIQSTQLDLTLAQGSKTLVWVARTGRVLRCQSVVFPGNALTAVRASAFDTASAQETPAAATPAPIPPTPEVVPATAP